MTTQIIKRGDYIDALNFAQSSILAVNKSMLRGETAAAVEAKLHSAWESIIACSEEAEAGGRDQDRLVLLILETRATDTLLFRAQVQLWSGPPFLVEDVVTSWEDRWETMRPEYRRNLVSFTARLFATGACSDWIALCGLHLLREVLESPIPLLPRPERVGDDDGGTTPVSFDPKTALELLPALRSFLDFGSARLAALCSLSADVGPLPGRLQRLRGLADPGALALAAGVDAGPCGFAPPRWRFWTRRLVEISEACRTPGARDGLIVAEVAACLGRMRDKEELIAGPLTRGNASR
ncbi:hypothetical protein PpBr36_03497 [Pyricularia pennisetigena]|uniref:hypothetical protein n=1 Tax=Pyricularia pennisetigena TaxID=1578925 RepID=UPI0011522EE6|nr:hypothetical protein PpBr36_03497 [Pyricularia pennisetigena]TLS31009.1 hypothetical protein PpBr36_03497 [Pyricularia pennisetigena]